MLRQNLSLLTHKHKLQNILITMPQQLKTGRYQSDIKLHPKTTEFQSQMRCETWQELVLLEACRQMVNAVAELFVANSIDKKSFVLHRMDYQHYGEAFVSDHAYIKLDVLPIRERTRYSTTVKMQAFVFSKDKKVAQASFIFSILPQQQAFELEQNFAKKYLNT